MPIPREAPLPCDPGLMPTFPHHRNNLPGPSLPPPSAPPPQQSFGAHFGSSGGLQQPLAPSMGELLHSLKK